MPDYRGGTQNMMGGDAKLSGGGWSNGLVVKALDSQSRGPVFKSTGWLQDRLSLSSFRGR